MSASLTKQTGLLWFLQPTEVGHVDPLYLKGLVFSVFQIELKKLILFSLDVESPNLYESTICVIISMKQKVVFNAVFVTGIKRI